MLESVVSDRANVSTSVMDNRLDQRIEQEEMKQRRRYLADIYRGFILFICIL